VDAAEVMENLHRVKVVGGSNPLHRPINIRLSGFRLRGLFSLWPILPLHVCSHTTGRLSRESSRIFGVGIWARFVSNEVGDAAFFLKTRVLDGRRPA
jgi:hypothetical protein